MVGFNDRQLHRIWDTLGGTGNQISPATTAYMDYVELNGTTWEFEDVAVLPPEPAPPAQKVPTMSE